MHMNNALFKGWGGIDGGMEWSSWREIGFTIPIHKQTVALSIPYLETITAQLKEQVLLLAYE
jgi:hypothetical protein